MHRRYFSEFLNYGIAIVLIFALLTSIGLIMHFFKRDDNLIGIMIIIIYIFLMIVCIKYKNKFSQLINFSNKKIIIYILAVTFILRLLWVIFIPTQPTSDFGLMYEYAREVAEGSYYGFKGDAYFARFAHDIVTVLYFSLFHHITDNPLLMIKFLNAILGTTTVYLIYIIIEETIGRKSALVGSVILALFPSSIMYTSQTMSENIAIPLYLLGIYMFIKGIKQEKKLNIF